LNSLYKEYVHGLSTGRYELLRALCAQLQRATLAVQAQELELWAAQAQLTLPHEAPVDTAALRMMSAAQLAQLLDMEALSVLQNPVAL
jgi:hypothetical protein